MLLVSLVPTKFATKCLGQSVQIVKLDRVGMLVKEHTYALWPKQDAASAVWH